MVWVLFSSVLWWEGAGGYSPDDILLLSRQVALFHQHMCYEMPKLLLSNDQRLITGMDCVLDPQSGIYIFLCEILCENFKAF